MHYIHVLHVQRETICTICTTRTNGLNIHTLYVQTEVTLLHTLHVQTEVTLYYMHYMYRCTYVGNITTCTTCTDRGNIILHALHVQMYVRR